jgi:hypothetical protein
MEILFTAIIIVVVLIACFYLADRYIVPKLPAPWGGYIEAILAIVAIVALIMRFIV